jgi:uncharacterized protein YbjT (DUF2867 family)
MILVTGATGTIGREVVKLLLEGGERALAVTRHPATDALPEGVRVVDGDPSQPQTLESALHDITTVFISPRALGDATAEPPPASCSRWPPSGARSGWSRCRR